MPKEPNFGTNEECQNEIHQAYKTLYPRLRQIASGADIRTVRRHVHNAVKQGHYHPDRRGKNTLVRLMEVSVVLINEIELRRSALAGYWIYRALYAEIVSADDVRNQIGEDALRIAEGLSKVRSLYAKNPYIASENFSDLLLTFAQDPRVVLVMLGDRLTNFRRLSDAPFDEYKERMTSEITALYAPLAHRLGLYRVKSEMEDLSLKYSNREEYNSIARKLSETKVARDQYIAQFIDPICEQVTKTGIRFEIKGRTKSIHSIWNKLKKQQIEFEKIYDLFAIRLILDVPPEEEKSSCWHVYSLITDMYQPNPKRLRDWVSIPKTNGYESLHITVLGPEKKWVEVQIRTQRMDEIAEKGLAAHWRYKGGKPTGSGIDEWLKHVRETLERDGSNFTEVLDEIQPALLEKEIFVFTPKGDLHKLSRGATLLDFAFAIHTNLGARCVGGRVNGKNATLRQVLQSGDQVEIQTAPSQRPKIDWLNIVVTSKARTKIKQELKENESKAAAYGKELLDRRLKNRKLSFDEAPFMRLTKRMGYKALTEFFVHLAEEKIDVNQVIESYFALVDERPKIEEETPHATPNTDLHHPPTGKEETLVIGENLKGIEYSLARCCNPIYGDDIFGFVSSGGGIRIHRETCPNAPDMYNRFPYRIIRARWEGKSETEYSVTLTVNGTFEPGIVTKISSIVNKERRLTLRGITIDSNAGFFAGSITVNVHDREALLALIKSLKTLKGVKQVERSV